jgi:uncharacterized membrane protein YdjX (TVP38/TMEM64 family)
MVEVMMNKYLRIFISVLFIIGIVVAMTFRDQVNADSLEDWVGEAGSAGPVVFMLIYIIGTVFFLPGSVLTLAGGALFGPASGTFYNLTAATIGAIISFIAARYLAHDWVERTTGGRLKTLKQGVESEGWKFVAFVRLVPLFPFNILNYALGLTKIKLSHYSIATYVCMLPGAIAYTYLGYVGREALAGDEAIIQKAMLAIALLAVVSILPGLIGKLRAKPMINTEELKRKLDGSESLLLLDVRTAEDYVGEQGHIENSLLIPLDELEQRLVELGDYLEKTIVIICRTDRRSVKAAHLLAQNGFADVHVVRMGMTDWINNAYPTV